MASKFKPISISLSPNVQKDDVALAWKLLFQPWKWAGHKSAPAVKQLEDEFKKYLGVKYAFSFNSGRSSLYAILKALNLPQGSDVLLQAFTCNAVPNPVLWAGLKPVYVDCGQDFNIDAGSLEKSVTSQSGALVVQHTFGLPANMVALDDIMRQKGITIIEDCAHALGAAHKLSRSLESERGEEGQKVGTIGKAAFFSFARDKVISCVYGGMAVTSDDEIGRKLDELQKEFGQPSLWWIKQQILHPILLHHIILPLYNFFDLGKLFLILSQWLHLLSKAVSWQEKRGQKPDYFPKALPNALAVLALNQLRKLGTLNAHRQKIAEFYYKELAGTKFGLPGKENNIFLRFAITHPKAHEIIYEAWHQENMLLGDWYTTAIAPDDTKMETMRYNPGSCPNAESLAKRTLNLPTHINISLQDAQRIVDFLKKWKYA